MRTPFKLILTLSLAIAHGFSLDNTSSILDATPGICLAPSYYDDFIMSIGDSDERKSYNDEWACRGSEYGK